MTPAQIAATLAEAKRLQAINKEARAATAAAYGIKQ